MKHLSYTVKIHRCDPDEDGYWVEVPALPGCVTQGQTLDEAVAMAKDAIEGFLTALVKAGEPVPVEEQDPHEVVARVQVEAAA